MMTEKPEVPDEKLYISNAISKTKDRMKNATTYKLYDNDIEYILKSLHLKTKNDWFARGLKAGKISKNSSGCCCVIEDDGETISSLCGAHKALHDKKVEDATKEIAKRKRLNENCPICESPLEDNGVCSDVGGNNCQYLKGVE